MRLVPWVFACLSITPVFLGEAAAYSFPRPQWYQMTHETEERGDWFTGFLTWNNGKGGISWSPDRQSEDPAGPPSTPEQDQRYDLQEQSKEMGIEQELEPYPVFEFVSDPTPKVLYLNGSRNMQVDLRVTGYQDSVYGSYYDPCFYLYKNDPAMGLTDVNYIVGAYTGLGSGGPKYLGDPVMEVQVKAGDRIVAGTPEASYIGWYYFGGTRPADPAGYGTCRYRTPVEALVIPAGTVIRLTLTHLQQHKGFQYGMSGDHESVIRLPLFPAEEILYRDPGRLPSDGGDESPATTSADGSAPAAAPQLLAPAGLAPFIVAAPLLALRRRNRSAAVLLILVSAGFAGCIGASGNGLGEDAEPTAGRASTSLQPIDETVTGGKGFGTIVGQVHDDIHVPLRGAHVSLLGTNNFTTSDGKGLFTMAGVKPGTYELRVDHKGYQSLQATVEVKANNLTRVDVLLVPLDKKAAGFRPHKHDLWGAKTEWPAMDETLGATCTDALNDCTIDTGFTLPPKMDGQTNIVYPGTEEVEVKVTWTPSAMGAERVGLMVRSNAGGWNMSIFAPREPGVPFKIPVTWEMTDNGHQTYSAWFFQIYVPVQDVTDPTPLPDSSAAPAFHVQVVLKRGGALPLEPAHPDHWGDAMWKVIQPGVTSTQYSNYYPPGTPYYYAYPVYVYPKDKTIVPPGTMWLQVNITANRETTLPQGLTLFYRPAASPYESNNWKQAGTPTVEGLKRTWKIAVQEDEADNMYARVSAWYFRAEITDDNANWVEGMKATGNGDYMRYTGAIIAHRDAMS